MTTGILVTMISAGVITAVGEEVCTVMNKPEIAKWIKVGGVTLTAGLGIGLVIDLLNKVKSAFGG